MGDNDIQHISWIHDAILNIIEVNLCIRELYIHDIANIISSILLEIEIPSCILITLEFLYIESRHTIFKFSKKNMKYKGSWEMDGYNIVKKSNKFTLVVEKTQFIEFNKYIFNFNINNILKEINRFNQKIKITEWNKISMEKHIEYLTNYIKEKEIKIKTLDKTARNMYKIYEYETIKLHKKILKSIYEIYFTNNILY